MGLFGPSKDDIKNDIAKFERDAEELERASTGHFGEAAHRQRCEVTHLRQAAAQMRRHLDKKKGR